MKKQNITQDSTEKWVSAQFIRKDGAVETFPNYMVSDRGRVGSLVNPGGSKRSVMKILKPAAPNKLGHLQVSLCTNGKIPKRTVHRLVLSSFHPELWSRDKNEVDHIDRCPTNNLLCNLQWTDRNGNCANRNMNPLKKIRVTFLSDGHTEEFDNMHDCSRAFGKSLEWCGVIIHKFDGLNKKYNILIEKI